MIPNIIVFSGNANIPLAKEISSILGLQIGKSNVKQFSDGESWVKIEENVRGRDIFVVQSISYPSMIISWSFY
jgi:ribose-phosphate pyrophosphokinase